MAHHRRCRDLVAELRTDTLATFDPLLASIPSIDRVVNSETGPVLSPVPT